MWELFSPFIRLGQGSTHTHKKADTHAEKRHRTQTQFVIYFQEGDFFRGNACLILCGRENLMSLNRFFQRNRVEIRFANWELHLGGLAQTRRAWGGRAKGVCGGGMKIYTAVLNQQRLMSLLTDSLAFQTPPPLLLSESAQRIPSTLPRRKRLLSVSTHHFASSCLFFLNTISSSNRLKVKSHKATAGANRLLSKLE